MPQSREEQLDRRGGAMPMRSLSADAVSHSFFYSTGDEAGDEDESSDQSCPTASSITSGTNRRHTSVDGEEDEDETNRLTRVMQRVANVAKNVPQRVGGRLAESHLLRRRGMDVKSSNLSAGTPHAHSPWYHYTSPIGMMSHSGSIPSSTGPSPLHRLRQRWHQRGSKSDFSAASLLSTKSSLYDVRNGIGRSSHRGAVGRVVGMRWNGPESADGDSLRSTSSFDPKLHFAVASGDVHAVLNMLEGGDGNVNQADYEGRTPLHVAASLQNIQMVEVLIRYKADVNATDRRNRTPLFDAREHNEIVDVLKRNGAVDSLKFFARKAKEADARAAAKHNSVHGSMESTDVITNHFLRKVLLSFLMPLGLLLVLNGTWFAVKFLVFTLLYYVVLVAYFVSEITIRPPWYRPNAKKLTMHQLPEYWQGIVNDPKYDLGIDFEDVEFYTSDHTKLSGWFTPAPHRSTVQVPSPTVGVSVESSSSTLWGRETGERGSTTTPLVSQKSLATDERESKIKSENDASVKDSFPITGIVLVHGGGRDRRAFLRHVRMFHEEGFPVLLFDFREHGKSQGSGMGFRYGIKERHDVLAACRYLRRRCTTIRTIVTMGTSVGGSAAIMAAALDSSAIDIVIAENPITTVGYFQHRHVLNVLGGFFQHTKVTMAMFEVFRWFCRKWINLRCGNIPSRKCQAAHVIHKLSPRPVLLMHGTADEVVPMEHSEILFQKAKEPKELWLAPDGFHCGLYDMFPQEFRRRVVTFIRRYENKIPNPGSPRVLASATGSAVSGSFSQPPASAPGRVSPK